MASPDKALRVSPSRSHTDTARVSDFCKCGHQRHDHVNFERLGHCHGKRDTRPLNVGGSELTPCECKQFKPFGWSNA